MPKNIYRQAWQAETDYHDTSKQKSGYEPAEGIGEHERSVRVARGAAESNSGFLSALQTSQVHP